MASIVDRIIGAVQVQTEDNCPGWNFVMAPDPEESKAKQGSPASWGHWNAESGVAARAIAEYLLARGMKGEVPGNASATHICIFKSIPE